MNETLKRLEEAIELIKRLKKSSHDRTAFRTNLNSFITSARSITFVMQKEFKHVSGFDKWYDQKVRNTKDEICEFFVKQRNIIQKEGSVRLIVSASTSVVSELAGKMIIPMIRNKKGKFVVDKKAQVTTDGIPHQIKPKILVKSSFKERPNEDAVDLCEKYLLKLKGLVLDCQSKFS
jgi:hypothetical protein